MGLCCVFLFSAVTKLISIDKTKKDISNFVFPIGRATVFLLIFAELLTAFLLTFFTKYGSFLAVFLLTIFTAYVIRALKSGNDAKCACFGSFGNNTITTSSLYRNLTLLAISFAIGLAAA